MLEENNNFISKYIFYLLAKFFHFTAKKKWTGKCTFIINEDTGLNIIP
jgi:hypothetical protein